MIGTLYIKLGLNETYFEVTPSEIDGILPFSTVQIEKMPIVRKAWGEVLINNYPYKYNQSGLDGDKLYDVLLTLNPDIEIYIKYISSEGTEIEGYFGIVDCDINDYQTFIKVTPTIFDQYTYLLEYKDTPIDVFGENNLLINGSFNNWTGEEPNGWELTYPAITTMKPYRDTLFGQPSIVMPSQIIWDFIPPGSFIEYESRMTQTVSGINKDRNVKISFLYALMELWNPDSLLEYLSFSVSLTDGVSLYFLDNDNSWNGGLLETYSIDSNALAIPLDSLSGFKYKEVITQPTPITGSITINFNHKTPTPVLSKFELQDLLSNRYYYWALLGLADIIIESSDISYIPVTLELSTEDLVEKEQNKIIRENGSNLGNLFRADPEFSFWIEDILFNYDGILHYFDIDGSPDDSVLTSSKLGLKDDALKLFYPDWADTFLNDKESSFYLAEMSELTIYEGETWNSWNKTFIRIKGVAKFAREEIRKIDEYDEFDELIPPAVDVGWYNTTTTNKDGRLWVRTPFNGTETTWELGEVDQSGGTVGGVTWNKKVTSRKIYPKSGTGDTYNSGADLKGIIKRIYTGTHETLKGKDVFSTFLFNDYNDDEYTTAILDSIPRLISEPDINYYTLEDNVLKRIAVIHSYDFKTNKADNSSDSVIEISFSDLMNDLMVIFPSIYWFVDLLGNLHIEHIMYENRIHEFKGIVGFVDNYQAWKYKKSEMFALEEYSQINSGYDDFTLSNIEYAKIVSNKRAEDIKIENKSKFITSDIQYCMENPNDIDNGLILVNYNVIDGVNILRYDTGLKSGKIVPNGFISPASALVRFGTYEGLWEKGLINGVEHTFRFSRRTKQGIDKIEIKGVYEDNYFRTDLGIAFATKEIDYEKKTTTINPVYRYNDYYIIAGEDDLVEI